MLRTRPARVLNCQRRALGAWPPTARHPRDEGLGSTFPGRRAAASRRRQRPEVTRQRAPGGSRTPSAPARSSRLRAQQSQNRRGRPGRTARSRRLHESSATVSRSPSCRARRSRLGRDRPCRRRGRCRRSRAAGATARAPRSGRRAAAACCSGGSTADPAGPSVARDCGREELVHRRRLSSVEPLRRRVDLNSQQQPGRSQRPEVVDVEVEARITDRLESRRASSAR